MRTNTPIRISTDSVSKQAGTSFPYAEGPAVYVIHENDEWVVPLREAFGELGIPYMEWFADGGSVDLDSVPPEGVFYNRMSASSHTRSHRFAVELSEPLLAWLEAHGRRVVNSRRALQLEVRKMEQYLELKRHGVPVPYTIAASGSRDIAEAARSLGRTPFIIKPNRGGKGLGVQLFNTVEELEAWLGSALEESLSPDGITLVQEYIRPAAGHITRMEFIGGKFYYAVEVDASGGFELCPADACAIDEGAFCPAPGHAAGSAGRSPETERDTVTAAAKPKFRIVPDFRDDGLIACLEAFFQENRIEVAAAEFAQDAAGNRFVYDLNMNTNYNRQAERDAGNGKRAMYRVAEFLGLLIEG
jgi:hypothetical protein